MEYNIYCDESCHLRRDNSDIMVLGGIYCPTENASVINKDIIDMKVFHGWSPRTELKWTQIAPSNVELFLDLVDYFFENENLQFRGYIARGKDELNLEDDCGYNDWYYKMYYRMLEFIFDSHISDEFNLYIDIKDTIGYSKVQKLQRYLNGHYHRRIARRAQLVRSDHIAILQMADVFIGALSYKNRKQQGSAAKRAVVEHIEELSQENLLSSVPCRHTKANWFVWTPDTWR